MRVLLIADFYPPHLGGVELQVQALARSLIERGDEVRVATVAQPGDARETVDGAITIIRVRGFFTALPGIASSSGRRYHPPIPDPLIARGIRRLIGEFQPDVVQTHGWIAYSAALALVGARTPLVLSVRDYGYACATRNLLLDGRICTGPEAAKCLRHASRAYGAGKGLAAVLAVLGLRSWLTRRTTVAHSVSRSVANTLRRDLLRASAARTPIETIPDIVLDGDADRSPPLDGPATAAIDRRLPSNPYILFVGALQPHKGLAPLLAAHARLIEPPPLVLIGTRWHDTPTFPDDVTVLADVDHRVVMHAWDRALFGVTPSLWPDPLPGVVREGMSRGKPIIGSAVGGIVDMIEDGVTGLLVEPGDVGALAGAMQTLIDDPDLAVRLGRQARADVAHYTPAEIGRRFEDLYARLAGRGGATSSPARIHIVGGPGAGKTTLARRIGALLQLPVHHLDDVARDPATGRHRPLERRVELVREIADGPRWVTDGVHVGWTDPLFRNAELIIWLDQVGWPVALARVVRRFIAGGIRELHRHRGRERFFRFRSFARHARDLIGVTAEIRAFDRSSVTEGEAVGRAELAKQLEPHRAKVVHCTGDKDIERIVAVLSRAGPGANPRGALVVRTTPAEASVCVDRDQAHPVIDAQQGDPGSEANVR